MKTFTLDKAQISLVLAISLIGGLTYRFSRVDQMVDINTKRIEQIDSKLDKILDFRTDIRILQKQIEAIQPPLRNTQFNVKRINSKMNQLAKSKTVFRARASSAFNSAPDGFNHVGPQPKESYSYEETSTN